MIQPSADGKKHWLLTVDEATDYTHSFFLKKKNDLIETMLIQIKNLLMKFDLRIKNIGLDNSTENRMLQAITNQQKLGIKFKSTAPGTVQQNSVVERKLTALMGRGRAMMTQADFDDYITKKFWYEAASTATKLDNMIHKTSLLHVFQGSPKYRKRLQILGKLLK